VSPRSVSTHLCTSLPGRLGPSCGNRPHLSSNATPTTNSNFQIHKSELHL
jgi:hypothetical protein